MGTKTTYDKAKVLEMVAEYFLNLDEQNLSSLALEVIHKEITETAEQADPKISIPKYSQFRKILIEHLSNNGQYKKGERLTAAVASRIVKININSDKIEDIINYGDYQVTIQAHSPIICIIKLHPAELLDSLAEVICEAQQFSQTQGRIYLIDQICQNIKNKNTDLILAVIPQLNKMIYLNKNGKIDKSSEQFNPICDSLCMFVKNTKEGRELVTKMRKHPISQ